MRMLLAVVIPTLILPSARAAEEFAPTDSAPIQTGTGHPFACGD